MDTSDVTPQLLSGGTVGGKLYGIPPTQNTQVFSYDFAQWQKRRRHRAEGRLDLGRPARPRPRRSATPPAARLRGVGDFGGIEDWFEVWLRQQGKTIYTPEGKLGYTAADVEKWWQMTDGCAAAGPPPRPS